MGPIKILVIDDSKVIHTLLHEVISKHNDITIIGDAYNGKEGVEKTKSLSPDVIIMDIAMPEMNGLEAIEEIMNNKPLPIIVFSSATKNNADISFRAIESGAVEIIEKPLKGDPESLKIFMDSKLVRSIKTFADFKVIRRIKRKERLPLTNFKEAKKIDDTMKLTPAESLKAADAATVPDYNSIKSSFPVIGIAASTGGPHTLKILIEDFSRKNFSASIVIVQHMADGFIKGFRDWISQYSSMPVILPARGVQIEPQKIYIAPGGHHLIFDKNGRIDFVNSPPIEGIRPAADIMFSSMGEVFKDRSIAIILTGMGHDGSRGIIKIKENNGFIISQDEKSSLLFGMPKSAFDTGLVDKVININYLSDFLEEYLKTRYNSFHESN